MFKKQLFLIIVITIVIVGFSATNSVDASLVDELKSRISDRNTKIQELEKEIAQYQEDLEVVGEEGVLLIDRLGAYDLVPRVKQGEIT